MESQSSNERIPEGNEHFMNEARIAETGSVSEENGNDVGLNCASLYDRQKLCINTEQSHEGRNTSEQISAEEGGTSLKAKHNLLNINELPVDDSYGAVDLAERENHFEFSAALGERLDDKLRRNGESVSAKLRTRPRSIVSGRSSS